MLLLVQPTHYKVQLNQIGNWRDSQFDVVCLLSYNLSETVTSGGKKKKKKKHLMHLVGESKV